MSQSKKPKELFYTGLTSAEYINGDALRCILCKGKDGKKQVVEIDGIAVAARIEIERLAFESDGFEVCFPVCLKCQRFLEGLISLSGGNVARKDLIKLLPLIIRS